MRPQKQKLPQCDDLFDKYFKVRMSYFRSRSLEYLKTYGMRVSGFEEIDRNLENQQIVTEMTVDRMFEKWRTGVTVSLIRYDDSADVYKIIHNHLIAWAEYLSTGINTGAAPLKDLVELDIFAGVVYDKARSVFSAEERQTAIATNFLGVQTINFGNILQKARKETNTRVSASGAEVTRVTESNPSGIRERNSFKDLFSSQINQVAGWRQP